MITIQELEQVRQESAALIKAAGIHITAAEEKKITAADFGLSRLRAEGVQILTLFETERIAAKILVLLPFQTEPEHWHPSVGDDPGKEEIIRALSGDLYFYIPGDDNLEKGFIVEGKADCYTMRHELVMKEGDQLVLPPGTKHWFQAGERGAVMYSFSTTVRDVLDQFTDPAIIRETKIIR